MVRLRVDNTSALLHCCRVSVRGSSKTRGPCQQRLTLISKEQHIIGNAIAGKCIWCLWVASGCGCCVDYSVGWTEGCIWRERVYQYDDVRVPTHPSPIYVEKLAGYETVITALAKDSALIIPTKLVLSNYPLRPKSREFRELPSKLGWLPRSLQPSNKNQLRVKIIPQTDQLFLNWWN